ncbi:hypothetical protein F4814DRAFT_370076 [Daldinia grandis]|nr:hypothetical protein F4814DRAFT_370076 [Daldinia grandis]
MADGKMQDVYDKMDGYIKATHWSKPYYSNHYHENSSSNPRMLDHVNCSYLSTPGRPPTLESLKQHAQSLAYLISTIAPNEIGAEVDNENLPKEDEQGRKIERDTFPRHQAYDWLNNLQVPYDNIDKAHRMPLNSLVNLVKENSDEGGVIFHCPLTETALQMVEDDFSQLVRPFQTHMTLLMHANECLERLDHEYSAMGGILGIIPTDKDQVTEHPELEDVKSTLVGQWLLYTQQLMCRMHELEIVYANAMDLLASEAIVPAQHLSVQGPDGRSGREIVFPQDRWILANAGEDVFTFIHQMLDKNEAKGASRDRQWLSRNVVGEALRVRTDEGEDYLRGIAHVDLETRFYRLRGSGRGPIFVLPAFSDRPSTAYTKEIENRPTVVTIPAPSNPGRTSAWDRRHGDMEKKIKELGIEVSRLTVNKADLESATKIQEKELGRLNQLNRVYEDAQGEDMTRASEKIAAIETERDALRAKFEEGAAERNILRTELAAYKRGRQQAQADVPPGITETEDGYLVTYSMLAQYEERKAVMTDAKAGVERVRNVLEQLAQKGAIDRGEFGWMEQIARCN